MEIGDRLRNAETEPVSGRLAALSAAVEPVENLRPLLRGDADACVADESKWPPFGHPGLDADYAAGRRELDRVVDQVREGFAHEVLVAANRDGGRRVNDHCNALRFGERLIKIEELRANRGEIEVFEVLLARP